MTDKDKIRAEIERLISLKEETSHLNHCDFNSGRWKGLIEVKDFIDSLPEEPVSEDLKEAWRKAYEKEKDEIFDVYDHHAGFVAGANWQKQQMMKDAIDAEVSYGKSLVIPSLGYTLWKIGLDFGDKVKLIIINETKK